MNADLLRTHLAAKGVAPDAIGDTLDRLLPEPTCAECQAVLAAARTRTAAAKKKESKASRKAKGKLKGAGNAEQLRQYWLHGKGAAKIRWGTPGDWTRCRRQLSKHLGVRAAGYCQLLHGRATGEWAGKGQDYKPDPGVRARAIAKQMSR